MAENYVSTAPSQALAGQVSKLKRAVAKGAAWTFAGYGTRQILRTVNKIILARLLLADIFGLSALVDGFMLGLTFFSDIGINLSIIQNKKGDHPDFLDTAWTIQVVRGLILWLITVFAGGAVANFYDAPILAAVLPIAGLTAVANGLNSTKFAMANRKLMMRELTLIDIGTYVFGLIVMFVWAMQAPSIWAIVAGNLATAFSLMILTHVALPGHRNRFMFKRWVWDEIYIFGRWVFISTAMAFLATQSDKLIIGKLMSKEWLGIYAVGATLAIMVSQGIMQLGHKVFFPSYSTLIRENPDQLFKVLRQARLSMIVLNGMAVLVFLFFGRQLVPFLFSEDFAEAGWMLQIIAIGTLVSVLSVTYDHVLIAKGQTNAVAVLFGIQFAIQTGGLLIGAQFGEVGIVIAIALVGLLIYPFKAFWVARQKLWQPGLDFPAIACAIAIAALSALYIF